MLSEQERRELQELARSKALQDTMRQIRAASRPTPDKPVDLDRVIDFLSTMSVFAPSRHRRRFVSYTRVLL